MEPHVIILNGPAGVGKSTVGRALAALAPNGVCIHGDDLRAFIVTRQPGATAGGTTYTIGATVAAGFLAAGYGRVVFEFVFEQPTFVTRFRDAYAATGAVAPVSLYTLWASLEVTTEREATRAYRDRVGGNLGERVAACHRTMAAHLDQLGVIVENVGQSADETAQRIHLLHEEGATRIGSATDADSEAAQTRPR